MQRYIIQTHVHGPASEGPASYMAQDFAAAATGLDLIWCMEHDWGVANFAKVQGFTFDRQVEDQEILARSRKAGETDTIPMTWVPVETPTGAKAGFCSDPVHSGTGSLRLELAGRDASQCVYELQAKIHHASFALFTRPQVGIAVCPELGLRNGGAAFIRFTLSQQPPDLKRPELVYVLGDPSCLQLSENSVMIRCAWSQSEWTELWLDPATDVENLSVTGGLDNSLSLIQIGVAGTEERVAACFDSLRIEPTFSGNQAFARQKELLQRLPLQHKWLVGNEVSYFGRHLGAFGSGVPLLDYGAPGDPISTDDAVDHIHRHGGLACHNHLSINNPEGAVASLLENRANGADLMEVAHGHRRTSERLRLWDLLGRGGLIITGIAGSDIHDAASGWQPNATLPAYYVTHVWAESLEEKDLLASLKAGRAYIADPTAFRGTLDISGPYDIGMGDVVLAEREWPALQATMTGVQPGDLAVWLLDGHVASVSHVQEEYHTSRWCARAPVEGFHTVRLQLHRPALATSTFGGLIAATNPIYFTKKPLDTTRRMVQVS